MLEGSSRLDCLEKDGESLERETDPGNQVECLLMTVAWSENLNGPSYERVEMIDFVGGIDMTSGTEEPAPYASVCSGVERGMWRKSCSSSVPIVRPYIPGY